MRQVVLEFGLPPGQGRRIVKMLDLLTAIRLNDYELEPDAASRRTRFTPDERTLSFVKPHHFVQPFLRGVLLFIQQGSPSLA